MDKNELCIKSDHCYLPVTFVYIKATEGATVRDKMYSVRAVEAENHGIIKGAYNFLHLKSNIDSQVKNFLETVSWVEGDMPPALDVECLDEIKECGKPLLLDYVYKWLTETEKRLNVKPIIYTTSQIQNMLLTDSRLAGYDYWLAKPGNQAPLHWTVWQRDHHGKISGCDGDVDINQFKGNYRDLLKYIRK